MNQIRQYVCLLIVSVFTFIACTEQGAKSNTFTNEVTQPEQIGGQKDENGCLVAAGYTWSQLKQDCVRTFEDGIRLNPQDTTLDQTTSAFIIFNDDESKVELYLPGQKGSLLLDRNGMEGNYQWINGDFALSVWKGYVLKQGNRTLYHGQ